MKKSIFGFILAILLICPFMSQVLRAEARDTDSKVTDADKIFYYSFDNISGGLIADEWGSRNAVLSGGKISSGKFGSALEIEKKYNRSFCFERTCYRRCMDSQLLDIQQSSFREKLCSDEQ